MSLDKTVSSSVDTAREGKENLLFPKPLEEIPRKESVNTSNRLNIFETNKNNATVWQRCNSLMVILILPQYVLT